MKKIKFAIIGTRGIPANYGGFETFAEEVAVRMAEKGISVLVIGDNGYDSNETEYKGVQIRKTKSSKPGNPLKFYKESLDIALENEATFILMCGVGGSMLIPFYSKKGANIAVNPDGLGFKRDKYAWWKKVLFFSQYMVASKIPKYIVCDSIGIQEYYKKKFGRSKNSLVIEYGTYINQYLNKRITRAEYESFQLPYAPGEYHLIVSRLEPENNVEISIKAYIEKKRKFPLVVVGNTNTPHAQHLLQYKNEDIHFIEGVYNKEKLQLLRAGAFSYWHGHSVGGTNPSLLEAMGSSNLCVCHNNIFNQEVVKESGLYFRSHSEASLIFNQIEANDFNGDLFRNGVLARAKDYYNWNRITERYLELAVKAQTEINV